MSIQQFQSKSTNESTVATSTVDADTLFHLGILLGKSCVCKRQLLKRKLRVYICDLYSSAGIICYIIR